MGSTLGFREVRAARKRRPCSWCGQDIEVGSRCLSWFWASGYDTSNVSMHPECYRAHCDDDCEEFVLYENPRGGSIYAD